MTKARLVVTGIDEGACAACGHPPLCLPTGSDPRLKEHDADRKSHRTRERRFVVAFLTMQIVAVARADLYFFVGAGRRAAGAAKPRASRRTAIDRPQRSALVPKNRSPSR